MTTEQGVRMVAGTVVLISVLLTWLVSEWWLLLTTFAGLNLLQSAFTGFCPPEMLMKKFGMRSCADELKAKQP